MLSAGNFFGEKETLFTHSRMSTVMCSEDSFLFTFTEKAFASLGIDNFIVSLNPLLSALLVAKNSEESIQKGNTSFSSPLSTNKSHKLPSIEPLLQPPRFSSPEFITALLLPEDVMRLAYLQETIVLNCGSAVFRQGEFADAIYTLVSGQVKYAVFEKWR